MNCKRKGNRNEHRSMRLLESQGYRTCRSAASRGEWDVIAIGRDDAFLVQVKSNRRPPLEEIERLQAFPCPSNVYKVIHIWTDGKPDPVVTFL